MGSSKNGTWPKVSNQNRVSVSVLLRTVSARNLHSPKCLCRQVSLWENVFWIPPSEVMLMRFRRHLTRGGLPFSLPPSLPPSFCLSLWSSHTQLPDQNESSLFLFFLILQMMDSKTKISPLEIMFFECPAGGDRKSNFNETRASENRFGEKVSSWSSRNRSAMMQTARNSDYPQRDGAAQWKGKWRKLQGQKWPCQIPIWPASLQKPA